ncbi:MAG: hypothetical protein H6R26_1754 [Proteobacteria bacterium]|nr:hypothetical protein [Pseudomonadota bacterium]
MSEQTDDSRTYLIMAWRQRIGDRLHYVLQHDLGWQDQAFGAGSQTAHWYSIVQYLTYDIADELGVGLRAEWFRDQDGFRYDAGEPAIAP